LIDQNFPFQDDIHRTSRVPLTEYESFRFQGNFFAFLSQSFQAAGVDPLDSFDVAREIEAELGDQGRVVLRYSGTEPLARVMVEGEDAHEIEVLANRLAGTVKRELG